MSAATLHYRTAERHPDGLPIGFAGTRRPARGIHLCRLSYEPDRLPGEVAASSMAVRRSHTSTAFSRNWWRRWMRPDEPAKFDRFANGARGETDLARTARTRWRRRSRRLARAREAEQAPPAAPHGLSRVRQAGRLRADIQSGRRLDLGSRGECPAAERAGIVPLALAGSVVRRRAVERCGAGTASPLDTVVIGPVLRNVVEAVGASAAFFRPPPRSGLLASGRPTPSNIDLTASASSKRPLQL